MLRKPRPSSVLVGAQAGRVRLAAAGASATAMATMSRRGAGPADDVIPSLGRDFHAAPVACGEVYVWLSGPSVWPVAVPLASARVRARSRARSGRPAAASAARASSIESAPATTAARGANSASAGPSSKKKGARRPASARPCAGRRESGWGRSRRGRSGRAACWPRSCWPRPPRATSSAISGGGLQVPVQAPARAAAATRSSTSAGVSSPSQPAPVTAAGPGVRPAAPRRAITASHSGLARPGSSPVARMSPPTSARTTRSQPRPRTRASSALGDARGPAVTSTSTVSVPRCPAISDSEKATPSIVVVRAGEDGMPAQRPAAA